MNTAVVFGRKTRNRLTAAKSALHNSQINEIIRIRTACGAAAKPCWTAGATRSAYTSVPPPGD